MNKFSIMKNLLLFMKIDKKDGIIKGVKKYNKNDNLITNSLLFKNKTSFSFFIKFINFIVIY